MNVTYFLPPSDKWTWKSTISKRSAGVYFPDTKLFNNGVLLIMSLYPINNNQKLSASF